MSLLGHILPPSRKQLEKILGQITEENRMYRALWNDINETFSLDYDTKLDDYVSAGFGTNPDVYAIVSKIATMASQIEMKEYDRDTGEEITDSRFIELINKPNHYQTLPELVQLWEIFLLITGNGMLYAPRLEGGNDKGKLLEGLYVMPSQYVSIKSKDWRQPIDNYIFEQDQEIKIPASDVIHVRLPNLEYNQGANFMGMSPVKVAASVVDTLNYGREYVKQSFKRGMPPGILARKGDASPTQAHEYKAQLERQWLSKHGKYTRAGIPIFGLGEYTWIKIGFDNFRDMQIIENNAEAFRTLCNIWGVPAIVFNDTAGTTFNNQAEARKSIYTNRVIPDLKLLSSYINASLAPAYTVNIIKFDFSGIEELQKDKRQQAEWVGVLVDKGIITRNQALEIMGLEKSEDPGMDDRLVPFNLAPLSSVIGELPPQQEVDKMLYAAGIDDYKMKK